MPSIDEIMLDFWNNKGENCARSSAGAILLYYDSPDFDCVYNTVLTYGGGVGERGICGAVLGTIAALNSILYRRGKDKDTIVACTDYYKMKFKEKFKSVTCKSLISEFPHKDDEIKEGNKEKRRENCTELLIFSVTIAKEILDRNQ